ncbi:MAG TPA: glycine cleavage system protein H [Polyangiaceae bacterium]|nr:glycine cleavage system protein H [Polyangiaceae bacterium]
MTEFLETTIDKFTFRVATDRLYSLEGLWVLQVGPGNNQVRIGVTDFVQQHSGDCAFATPKPVGTALKQGEEIAALETVKVNIAFASPVSGTVVAINGELELSPEKVNQSPFDDGWLAEVEASHWEAERAGLLAPAAYFKAMQDAARAELDKP